MDDAFVGSITLVRQGRAKDCVTVSGPVQTDDPQHPLAPALWHRWVLVLLGMRKEFWG